MATDGRRSVKINRYATGDLETLPELEESCALETEKCNSNNNCPMSDRRRGPVHQRQPEIGQMPFSPRGEEYLYHT